MSSTRAGPIPPGSSSGRSISSSRPVAPSLSCNLCNKALVTTCFVCACDCVFCEGECCNKYSRVIGEACHCQLDIYMTLRRGGEGRQGGDTTLGSYVAPSLAVNCLGWMESTGIGGKTVITSKFICCFCLFVSHSHMLMLLSFLFIRTK